MAEMDRGYYEVNKMSKNYPVKVVPHQDIIRDAGYTNVHIEKHWHRSLEIVLMYNGNFVLWKNGTTLKMKTGDIVIINSEEPHEFYDFIGRQQGGCSILISYRFLKETFRDIDNIYFELDKNHPAYKDLMEMMLRMQEIYYGNDEWYNLQIRSVMYELLYLLMKFFRKEKSEVIDARSQKYEKRYKEVITYLNEHYMDNLLLHDVANLFGYNPEYFSRSFKKYMGVNFKTYIVKLRLNAGKRFLMDTDKTITDIALEIGAPDAKSFIRDFKKNFEVTPAKFRKMNSAK